MSDIQGAQLEGSSTQEASQTVSIFVGNHEFKIDQELLLRKVKVLRDQEFPFHLETDIESFKTFLIWLHEDKLPVLNATYHEKDNRLTYSGYEPEKLYRIATWFELSRLADNIMDCIRRVHISFSVGFSRDEIKRIYNEQIPHHGLSLFTALWIYLEDTRPNNYGKVTTKSEREALLEDRYIAHDMAIHSRPWFAGNQSACRFHFHAGDGGPCPWDYSIDVGLRVVNKKSKKGKERQEMIQTQIDLMQTERSAKSSPSEASINTSPDWASLGAERRPTALESLESLEDE